MVASAMATDIGGKGFNQAVVCHRSGTNVHLVAAIGQDAEGMWIKDRVSDCGLEHAGLVVQEGLSDRSVIYVADNGENCIVSTTDRARSLTIDIVEPALERLTPADTLLLQGNLTFGMTEALLRQARNRKARTFVNPAPITFDYQELWPMIDVVVVNDLEGDVLTGAKGVSAAAEALLGFGVQLVLVTCGRDGLLLCDADQCHRIDAPSVPAVDSAGAGDVVCGVLAAALDQGMALEPACRWAVAAASLSVTRRGTLSAFPSHHELSDLRSL